MTYATTSHQGEHHIGHVFTVLKDFYYKQWHWCPLVVAAECKLAAGEVFVFFVWIRHNFSRRTRRLEQKGEERDT